MTYRPLHSGEIAQLENQGCWSDNWQWISVKEGFIASKVRRTQFSGHVQLGKMDGANKPEGINDSHIDNCIIEDHVYINRVGKLSHYMVRSHANVENCATIEATPKATFGNGTQALVINEAGGRDILLYDGLTAQTAWLMAFMCHRKTFVSNLKKLITEKATHAIPEKGIIGHHARVVNCVTLHDVLIGDYGVVEGATHLKNGTIASSENAPTHCGHGVMAENFFLAKGSRVDNGSIVRNSFVGEGCIVDRQFSADHTVCFTNSQLYHGEACSAFCAPYTVSHHKSTLLIAGFFSFINVGSGSNQSNHMYKLGPVHQGILERGCKLSSDSYLLWPAKIGPFTFVMGRHYSNPDLGSFPFSYLLDEEGCSSLVPGANLRSIGTLRDSDKWPGRDIRKGEKSDLIHFELLHPFIVEKALKGKMILQNLEQTQNSDKGYYTIGDVRIKKPALKRGIVIYDEIAILYTGKQITKQLKENKKTIDYIAREISKTIQTENTWCDVSGMFMTEASLLQLVNEVESGQIASLSKVMQYLNTAFAASDADEWQWLLSRWEDLTGMEPQNTNSESLETMIQKYKKAAHRFGTMLIKDAQKEFNERSKIGYGYNDDPSIRFDEFTAIRGTCDENAFVEKIRRDIAGFDL
jgi:hypothetical protein